VIPPGEFRSRPPILASRLEQIGGASLLLVVTVFWIFALSADTNSIAWDGSFELIAAVFSTISLVVTGYLLGQWYVLGIVWIPGLAMTAVGFLIPSRDGLIFLGPLVALFGGLYFVPFIALGVWLRRSRRVKRLFGFPQS
jgi:hypothetical protein